MEFEYTATPGAIEEDDDVPVKKDRVKRRWLFGTVGLFVGQLSPASFDNALGGGASGDYSYNASKTVFGGPLTLTASSTSGGFSA